MKNVFICVMIVILLFSLGEATGEGVKKKEKDVIALSYLAGYKCYQAMEVMLGDRRVFSQAYRKGFAEALMIDINKSAFDTGFQDARTRYPSRYKEDILKR